MADALPLRAAVIAVLRTIRGITVYDGYVPDRVPTDAAGYILPYVVFFGGVGDEIPERDLSGLVDLGGLRWDVQTTAVAANPDICVNVAQTVRRTLTNLPLGTHYLLPNPDGFKQETPIRDITITPARFMLPAPWRLDTT